jgi:hypothetical protein
MTSHKFRNHECCHCESLGSKGGRRNGFRQGKRIDLILVVIYSPLLRLAVPARPLGDGKRTRPRRSSIYSYESQWMCSQVNLKLSREGFRGRHTSQ